MVASGHVDAPEPREVPAAASESSPPAHTFPPLFVERMRSLLGAEADEFFAQGDRPLHAGLRVNLLKLTPSRFVELAPWPLEPVPWCPAGFAVPPGARPGKHPFHAAGLYYLQEPSAMAVVEVLDVRPGHLVLDLAAAPGGKTTHIAALLGGQGVLIANELEGSRVKALGENAERWGARNVVLTNDTPERLGGRLGPIFDRVLLDAPCSGEGMFRKSAAARDAWSSANVAGCAARQARILEHAARLVRPDGLLVYSTCTFAPEENEQRVAAFLDTHADWELVDIPKRHGFAAGRPDWAGGSYAHMLDRAARLWPHRLAGEGHFIALLANRGTLSAADGPAQYERQERARQRGRTSARRSSVEPQRSVDEAARAWLAFEQASLHSTFPAEQLVSKGDQVYLRPSGAPAMDEINVVRPGLWLGTAKPGRFEPSHALALALMPKDARMVVELGEGEIERYLRGETIEHRGPDGWVLMVFGGWPIGWGRRVGNTVKNFYPKGLRWP